MTIDPTMAVSGLGPEWSVGSVGAVEAPADATQGGSGFGSMLSQSIQSLADSQTQAAEASRALATGQASDPTAVVMAVERAQLAMQMASQIRTKAVEAAQTIFQTQV
ncbi:flagellar hook-basal body complex protein FliE [Solirubrobacter sp. CPCC 204708]|uniref:Flagellar hook-basal body complex protein FliE n=1 Tax=Solirubrobacter deserti TaxID=2282478 RepID=A0ABT4RMJ8_9ACTN|nr:flagellar hook-basal body complex protein FliE [Solirubrobacter deserti]MBE2316938.1 flagellar hook-basal body complex protein FliE [Solirubrobacter deserti]MDA0139769.1 flagellar hook-basal body complex protein FliE [Solirubrobacter deserti]